MASVILRNWVTVVAGGLYVWQAVVFIKAGNMPMGITFFAYALANFAMSTVK